MARTSRRKPKTPIIKEYLEREYVKYVNEYIEKGEAGLVDFERMLDFQEWAEDFAESNF